MPYNIEESAKKLMVGQDDLLTILDFYFTEAFETLDRCHTAMEDGDSETLKRLFHSLKGSSANFRLHDLWELASRMEAWAGTSNLKMIAETLPLFRRELESIVRQVKQE